MWHILLNLSHRTHVKALRDCAYLTVQWGSVLAAETCPLPRIMNELSVWKRRSVRTMYMQEQCGERTCIAANCSNFEMCLDVDAAVQTT